MRIRTWIIVALMSFVIGFLAGGMTALRWIQESRPSPSTWGALVTEPPRRSMMVGGTPRSCDDVSTVTDGGAPIQDLPTLVHHLLARWCDWSAR
jgi:hypothetical protein